MEDPVQTSQGDARQFTCPICKRRVTIRRGDVSGLTKFFPFCSERCKLIDLGAWFDSEYRIAGKPEDDPDAPPADETSSG